MKRYVVKVLTGNEHGGAAMSSELLIDGILVKKEPSLEFKILMLCDGNFAKKIKAKYPLYTQIIKSSEPPIIAHPKLWMQIFNRLKLFIWFTVSFIRLSLYFHSKKVDIIHTTNNYALIVCSFYRMLFNVKLISHWRCIGGVRNNIYKYITGFVDQILCISQSVKESLPPSWQTKCIVIFNGVNVKALRNEGQSMKGKLRNYLNIEGDLPLFGTIGSYTEVKCHSMLIEACKLIHERKPYLNFKCALIGSTPNKISERYLLQLKQKVSDYNINDFIEFVPDNALGTPSTIITDFNFFVGSTWLNGKGEGFGLIYIEAMAQSLPIIAIGVGAAREIITPSIGILLEDNSIDKHAEQMMRMLDVDSRSQYNPDTIFSEALKFDISICVEKVLERYNESILPTI